MIISKRTHSCLIIEEKGKTILIDPGSYTAQENALKADDLKKLDYILITHEHHDHMHLPLIKEILAKFPDATVITNKSAAATLAKEGIRTETSGNSMISITPARHEKILMQTPENIMFTIAGRLTHPGDSLNFENTTEILALPIQAPWGSFVNAIQKAAQLKPKTVIPIHDWHWKDEARIQLYKAAADYLKKKEIKFKAAEKGETIEV